MGKKIASGADGIVLDVKVGDGAFMKTEQEARDLAELLVAIGQGVGRQVRAVISDMSQPLGCAVGNALELHEALDTLHGGGPADFRQHCLAIAAQMLLLARPAYSITQAKGLLEQLLDEGHAWTKFCEWIAAQGGDLRYVESPAQLPSSRLVQALRAPRAAYISGIRADAIGLAAMLLGGGRAEKADPVDHAVGVVLHAKIGDWVEDDQPLLTIHANDETRLADAMRQLPAAYSWSDQPVAPPRLTNQLVV
jgi:pyrimidine-nucleoside phosphorylase